MKYIVETKSTQIRNKFISSLKQKHNIQEGDYFVFDFEEIKNISEAYMNYMSVDLFGSIKMIVVKNATFLNTEKLDKILEPNFVDMITMENDNIIIFTVDKFNKTKSQRKKFEKSFEILSKEQPKGKELNLFVEKFFANHELQYNPSVVQLIVEKTDNNFEYLVNELNKLMLTMEKINTKLVDKVIYDYKGESIFLLIESLLSKNTNKLESILISLKEKGMAIISILEYLINDLTLIAQVKTYTSNGGRYSKFSEKTELHPFRVKKLHDHGSHYSLTQINDLLEDMIRLSIKFKSKSVENKFNVYFGNLINIINK